MFLVLTRHLNSRWSRGGGGGEIAHAKRAIEPSIRTGWGHNGGRSGREWAKGPVGRGM